MASAALVNDIGVGTPAAPPSPAPTATVIPAGSAVSSSSEHYPSSSPSASASLALSLDTLPREILQQILSYLPSRDVISCTLVNQTLSEVCESPLLWRGLCVDEYHSWHADHCMEERLGHVDIVSTRSGGTGNDGAGTSGERARKRSVLETDWKQLFASRKLQDRRFREAFDRVLSRQDGRVDAVAQITSRGEDARDLLDQLKRDGERRCYRDFNADSSDSKAGSVGPEDQAQEEGEDDDEDDDDDSLARAYWANEMLGCINRAQALREVTNVVSTPRQRRRDQQDYPLVNALWAIDYFVAESPPETLPQMLTHLDNIAAGFREEYPGCFSSSPTATVEARRAGQASGTTLPGRTRRQRALCLAEFVREHDLVGVRSPETYHNLQNSLISVALCEKDHPSLPLIGHAIYCALAERVGLVAGLTNTPRHVYITVRAPDGTSLDDEIIEGGDAQNEQGQTAESEGSAATESSDESGNQPEDELDPSRTMFLDPFHHEGEVPLAQLRSLYLPGMGGRPGGGVGGLLGFASLLQNSNNHMSTAGPTAAELATSLAPASTRDMMFRMARNLQETLRGSAHSLAYRTALTDPTDEFVDHLLLPNGGGIKPTLLNPYRAGYCAWWLQTLLDEIGGLQHRALYNFVESFMHHFKETDCPLVVEYMLAAFCGGFVTGPGVGGGEDVLGAAAEVGRDEAAFIETVLAHVRREDGRANVPKRRHLSQEAQDQQEEEEEEGKEQQTSESIRDAGRKDTDSSSAEPHPQPSSSQPPSDLPTSSPPPSASTSQKRQPLYRVGDLFQHRRYRYKAVITGWDATCQASEQWMQQMCVDSLPHGRSQSFYHVLVEDHSTRYVAQENINVIVPAQRVSRPGKGKGKAAELGGNANDGGEVGDDDDDDDDEEEAPPPGPNPPLEILRIAGRYFKRWDPKAGKFVSNVRDEYPDD